MLLMEKEKELEKESVRKRNPIPYAVWLAGKGIGINSRVSCTRRRNTLSNSEDFTVAIEIRSSRDGDRLPEKLGVREMEIGFRVLNSLAKKKRAQALDRFYLEHSSNRLYTNYSTKTKFYLSGVSLRFMVDLIFFVIDYVIVNPLKGIPSICRIQTSLRVTRSSISLHQIWSTLGSSS
ncbi:hypothetical protein LXL04_002169 [Taraxacum kok-saghyz]